jgi:hypothetical protein
MSKHSAKRVQQRGFSDFSLKIIKKYGRSEKAPGGATKIFLGKREYQEAVTEFKKAIQLLDKAKGGNIIVSDNEIITVYKN